MTEEQKSEFSWADYAQQIDQQADPMPPEAPLEEPGFGIALKHFFTNLFVFSGRSSRSDYWWPQLILIPAKIILIFWATFAVWFTVAAVPGFDVNRAADLTNFTTQLIVYYSLINYIFMVVQLGVQARRFHDQKMSALFLLFNFVPLIGPIVIFIFMVIPGQKEDNIYGKVTHTTSLPKR